MSHKEMDKTRGRLWMKKNAERADQLVCSAATELMDNHGCSFEQAFVLIKKVAGERLEEGE